MPAAFDDYATLLGLFLDRRPDVAEAIDRQLLNVQGKESSRLREREYFASRLEACFLTAASVPRHLTSLATLAAAHQADGFEPAPREAHAHNVDALDLIVRAYEHWDRTRWPGRNGRLAFAHTVYAVAVLGQLEHLSLRIWDDGGADAGRRLALVQQLLGRLNADPTPVAFLRDARWLIQTAQGPLTR